MTRQLLPALLAAACMLPLLSLACEDTSEVSGPASVRLDEWSIELGASQQKPGPFEFQVQNVGTMDHELILIRTDLAPDKLPVDSGAVNLKSLDVVAEKDGIERRKKTVITADLNPGSYAMICNISGHYALGMHTGLTVQ